MSRTARHGRPSLRFPVALAVATVLAEVAYPLLSGGGRDVVTVVTVVLFCAASTAHAAVTRGTRWAFTMLVTSAGVGLVAEACGTRYGVPFGQYTYASSLGAKVIGVPVVIPLAWAMMSYPALLIGHRLATSRSEQVAVSAVALAAWDLFLDPQMVEAGHWRWQHVTTTLPGSPDVPVSNYVGWFVTAAVVMTLLRTVLRIRPADDRVPYALYLWTYVSSLVANLAFFGRPAVAVVGGVTMGAIAVPLAASLWRRR